MSSYTIKQGDTLWDIARANGIPLEALQSANANVDPRKLRVGSQISLPQFPMGSTTTHFDPNTPRQWDAPFSMFPTTTDAPHGNSWGPTLPDAADVTGARPSQPFDPGPQAPPPPQEPVPGYSNMSPMGKGWEIIKHLAKGAYDTMDYPRAVTMGEKDLQSMDPETGEYHTSPEGVGQSLGLAASAMSGGIAGVSRAPRHGVKAGDPALDRPLPEGGRRELAGPFFEPNTGTVGLWQKTRGTPTSRARSNLHEDSMDPLWWDAVINRAPASSLKNTPDEIIPTRTLTLGSGPVRQGGDNVIPFDPSAKKLTDPKTNLERRVAKRNQSGEVVPEYEFHNAKAVKYAEQARKERIDSTIKAKDQVYSDLRDSKIRADVAKMTPEQWMDLKPDVKRDLMAKGIHPKFIKKGSKEHVLELLQGLKDFLPEF